APPKPAIAPAPRPDTTATPSEAPKVTVQPSDTDKRIALKPGEVDTDNYQFDPDVLKANEYRQRRASATTLPQNGGMNGPTRLRRRENVTIRGPFKYEGLFVANDSRSGFRIDPIRGFGLTQTLTMNDLLENHI